MYLIIGVMAFCFYYVYDLNTIFLHSKVFNSFFAVGSGFLAISTIMMIYDGYKNFTGSSVLWILMAVIFAVLLIYTLFFALPFQKTYIKNEQNDGKMKAYKNGIYALCRHPGVLWLIGFYLTLSLALGGGKYLKTAVIFSLLDLIYIVLQDCIIFPKQFYDYEEYKKEAPFLIPNKESIVKAVNFLDR